LSDHFKAFSSEVDTGSRRENTLKGREEVTRLARGSPQRGI
jgi:hypothetical protein